MSDNDSPRRKRLDILRFDTMQIHLRHLLIAVCWAATEFVLDYLLTKIKISTHKKVKVSELILLVSCDKKESAWVEKVLRNNTAFGIGIVKG